MMATLKYNDSELKVSVKNLTAEQAQDWLDNHNKSNRVMSANWKAYSKKMLAGMFDLNAIPIMVDDKGNVFDGQHRLKAWSEAGKKLMADEGGKIPTMEFVFIEGVDHKTSGTANLGKNQTGGDTLFRDTDFMPKIPLETDEGKPNKIRNVFCKIASTCARFIYLRGQGKTPEDIVKFDQVLLREMIYKSYPEQIQEAVTYVCDLEEGEDRPLSKYAPLAYWACLLVLVRQDGAANYKLCKEFIKNVRDGENLSKDDPAMKLREKLVLLSGQGNKNRNIILNTIALAWQYKRIELPIHSTAKLNLKPDEIISMSVKLEKSFIPDLTEGNKETKPKAEAKPKKEPKSKAEAKETSPPKKQKPEPSLLLDDDVEDLTDLE